MKHIIMVVALLCCVMAMGATTISNSSNQASLQGYVTDAQDGDTLIGVTVALPELNIATTTDAKGHYSFKGLPQLTTTIQVSFLGHENITQQVNLAAAGRLDFVLKENSAMLKEVIVTGLTGNVLRKNSPTPVSVLTAREMQGTLSTNIIDAVAHEPGVAQVTTGTGISKPVIRGMGYNRVVVVNDGVRQEGQQWGDEHGIEIDPQSVSSVEILKGPASLMYGSDALAGVPHHAQRPRAERGAATSQRGLTVSNQQRPAGLLAEHGRQPKRPGVGMHATARNWPMPTATAMTAMCKTRKCARMPSTGCWA
jgi:iron complex outermembrane receptor protein